MRLKKWVEKLLIGISFIAFMILVSDCENTLLFVISKIISLGVIIVNAIILSKNNELF